MPRKHSFKITYIFSSMLICILQQLYRLWKWKKNPGSGQKSYIHMSKNHLRSFGAFVQSVNAILILHIYNPHQNNDPPKSELGQNDRKKSQKGASEIIFFSKMANLLWFYLENATKWTTVLGFPITRSLSKSASNHGGSKSVFRSQIKWRVWARSEKT